MKPTNHLLPICFGTKEIARSHLNNKLEKISCEYAAVYFKSPELLDPILIEEWRDDEGNDTFNEKDDE